MSNGYEKKEYGIFEKTLYVQRLLYAIDADTSFVDDVTRNLISNVKKDANKEIDAVIESLQYCLELTGFFPQIRDVSSQSPSLWRQPTRIIAAKKEC